MSQPIEYFVWVRDSNGMSYHGLKPVTQKRGDNLIARYSKSWPENHYWLEPIESLPPGECAHVLPEQSCQFCQPHKDELELI